MADLSPNLLKAWPRPIWRMTLMAWLRQITSYYYGEWMLGHSRSNSMSDDEEQSVQMEGTHRGKEKAKRKRPPMKKRSEVWNHFTLLEDNPTKCRCNYCGKQYQCHSRLDGITNMTRHIKTCESYKTFRAQQSGSQQNLTAEGGQENASNLVLGKGWSQDVCRRAITKMIIMAHFIDSDWCLNKRIISFSAIEDHRGKSIGKKIVACLQDWGIERLFAITVDNATANDIAVGYVTMQLLIWRNDDALVWNSTYLMLMTALKFQAAFDRMAELDKPYEAYFAEKENNVRRVGPPRQEDWESAERIVKFLKVFYDATLLFSASLSVTSNLCYDTIGLIESSLTALEKSIDPWVSSMAYMHSPLVPHHRCMVRVVLVVAMEVQVSQRFTTEANLVDVAGGECDNPFRVARPFLGYARKVSVQNESRRVVSEVEMYLKDTVEDPSNLKLNVLLWWRVNGSRYLILEKIARDVLVVPVSTVASEFAFSIERHIIDEYRSSLTPAMVDALICTEN
ncbi:putative AC transposase [Citrus sinensis]|uniref:AC transposase n=1 Tax=Citrus sinensis TaxID=2711 RepID=A0ACB8IN65_CITSI|nr:putative AC transposase [Citrus sinensis]